MSCLRERDWEIKGDAVMNKLLLTGALLLAACQPAPAPAPPLAGAKIGGPFALTDQDGRQVTDRSFAGRYRIMYFGYTFCPDVCPTDVQAIAAGLKLVEREDAAKAAKIVPVFVTVDPARDTMSVLKQFTGSFHPRLIGLTGSTAAIEAMKKTYAVYSKNGPPAPGGGYLVDHSRAAYLMDPDGKPLALVSQDKGPRAVADAIGQWVR